MTRYSPTKTLNVKIPLTIAQAMDDKGQLNPTWVSNFLKTYLNKELPNEPIQEFTFNYAFSIDNQTHRYIKLKALENDLPMNEFCGRLLANYY